MPMGDRDVEPTKPADFHYGKAQRAMDATTANRVAEPGDPFGAVMRWHAMAARELARHTPVDGVCWACRLQWPCPTCVRADFALAAD
jgi:hypothetical protein